MEEEKIVRASIHTHLKESEWVKWKIKCIKLNQTKSKRLAQLIREDLRDENK